MQVANNVLDHKVLQDFMFNIGDPTVSYITHLPLKLKCIYVAQLLQTNGLVFLMLTWLFQFHSLLYLD
jgi:hypothetical protein